MCTGTVDEHRAGGGVMEPGDALPELKVTPDKYLTVRYAGASGDFNPIHIDEELARSVGPARAHPPRPVDDGPGGARRDARAAGGPEALRRLEVQFRGMGLPGAGDHRHGRRCKEVARGRHACSSPPTPSRAGRRSSATPGPSSRRRPPHNICRVLTPRQELLLAKVIDGFAATGQPVGSKALAADPDITCGPSTVRNELAVLEEQGLLAHPHTSAGRVPTDAGYRYYVDRLLAGAARRRAGRRRARGWS